MNVLRNLRAFFIAYLTTGIITLLFLLIKARVHINPFYAFPAHDLSGLLYQFALFYFFTLSPIIALASLMLALAAVPLRGGVIARVITMAAVAVIAAAYPIYMRYVHAEAVTKELRAFDIAAAKKLLPVKAFVALDSGKIMIGSLGGKDTKYDYRDITYLPNGSPFHYHASYGIQKGDTVMLLRVDAYHIETGAASELTELAVPASRSERPGILTDTIIAAVQWVSDVPKNIGRKKGSPARTDASVSTLFARFSDPFFVFDTLFGFPLILIMRDVFFAALRVIPYAHFVPVFTLAIFLFLASAFHIMYQAAVPRLTFHNVSLVIIIWLLFQAIFTGIADAAGLSIMLKRASMLQMLFGYLAVIAGMNLFALVLRVTLSFRTYYRRAAS